jgi:ligand-binding sensor protein
MTGKAICISYLYNHIIESFLATCCNFSESYFNAYSFLVILLHSISSCRFCQAICESVNQESRCDKRSAKGGGEQRNCEL